MKIYEYLNGLRGEEHTNYLGETDQEIEFGTLLKINNRYYCCCKQDLKEDILYVEFVNFYLPRNDDDYCDDDLRCPFCGYENECSSELLDEDDEYICPQCGSTLKYNREIKVSYDVEVVEEKEPTEIKFKEDEQ